MFNSPVIIVHGGAGTVSEDRIDVKLKGVRKAVKEGYNILMKDDGTALDAVEIAVRSMEDNEYFNAGYGSVLNLDGEIEMCASIMDGKNLNAGAVAIVKDIANPISLARLVMEKSPHVLLGAEGAKKFAKDHNIPILEPGLLVTEYAKKILNDYKAKFQSRNDAGELSTVGAVAIDRFGNVAAATSTGGLNGKMVGRISDTSQIGSGTYAINEFGAVSTTGYGEAISKTCLAHAIINELKMYDCDPNKATKIAVDNTFKLLNKTTGAITVTKHGDFGVYFTSKHMAWAAMKDSKMFFGINPNEEYGSNI